jgi:hypothetical protein
MLYNNVTSLRYYIYNTLAQFETLKLGVSIDNWMFRIIVVSMNSKSV